jgi:hypothetical protein
MNRWRGIKYTVRMNTKYSTQRKEVTALDADVPLLRPSLIRFNLSELRLLQMQADRPNARHGLVVRAG